MAVVVRITADEVKDMPRRMSKARAVVANATRQEMQAYGRKLVEVMKEEAPRKTGVLANSIRFKVTAQGTNKMELSVTAGNKQRPEVIIKTLLFGSKPHIIKPKRAGYPLKWVDPRTGRVIRAYKVRHPGTNSNNFMERALELTKKERAAMVDNIGRITMQKILIGR